MENNNEYGRGFQDGLKNKAITVAIKMIKYNFDKKVIEEISELSEEQINIIEQTLLLNQHKVDKIVEENLSNNHSK